MLRCVPLTATLSLLLLSFSIVTYGAVIDAFAKSMERNAAARADALLANMVALHQSDPVRHADLRPNTYVFNTVINAWAKSKERGAAAKAEEMLVAMDRLHASGFPGLKPDAFTYTAVIDAYAKSGYRGAASRADLLLDQMEAKYAAGDQDLKPNTCESFVYDRIVYFQHINNNILTSLTPIVQLPTMLSSMHWPKAVSRVLLLVQSAYCTIWSIVYVPTEARM